MVAADAPPRTKRKPNKVKLDEDRPLTNLDKQLKRELEAFREKIHAEFWGEVTDFLFGSHVFLTTPQILHLCHLANANVLHTLEDLETNFRWSWMLDYGRTLLKLIPRVYDYKPPSTTISANDEIGTSHSPLNDSEPSTVKVNDQSSSGSTGTGKPRATKGPHSQRCSVCGTLGHNKSNPCRPKKATNAPVLSS